MELENLLFKFSLTQNKPDSGNIKIRKKLNFSFFDQTGEQFEDKKR